MWVWSGELIRSDDGTALEAYASRVVGLDSSQIPSWTDVNVLHISETDAGGGSARSAMRIHDGLSALGHRSRVLVGRHQTSRDDVRPLKRHAGWQALDRVGGTVADRLDLQYLGYASTFAVVRDSWFHEADVVQLYNTHGSYFNHAALPFLTNRRPTVWRLSDMWAATGHVAYSYDCERWRHGCGSCPYLGEYPALGRDRSALLWKLKKRIYERSRLTLVAPSRWLEGVARESPLLGRFDIRRIPNGVDLDVFRPMPREEARRRLDLHPDRPLVLFSSLAVDDRRKGAVHLAAALVHLADRDFDVATVGAGSLAAGRQVRSLGRLDDEHDLAAAYAAADLYVLPTLAENLPNVALESIACGTPCVAFETGGVPDAVRHGETGWLAPTGDDAALAVGIAALLDDAALRRRLGEGARALAESEFDVRLESRRFAELLEEVVEAWPDRR